MVDITSPTPVTSAGHTHSNGENPSFRVAIYVHCSGEHDGVYMTEQFHDLQRTPYSIFKHLRDKVEAAKRVLLLAADANVVSSLDANGEHSSISVSPLLCWDCEDHGIFRSGMTYCVQATSCQDIPVPQIQDLPRTDV